MRHSFITVTSISAFCIGCGGDSDGSGSKPSTTSPTTNSTTGSPATNTTTTSPSSSSGVGGSGGTTGTGGSSGGSTSDATNAGGTTGAGDGSGGTTGSGGSAGENTGGSAGENTGGSAGENTGGSAGGGAGGTGGTGGTGDTGGTGGTGDTSVVIAKDCGYEACGGDVAGTDWSYSRICVEEDALLDPIETLCPSVELLSSSGEVTGTISFDADSYNQDVSFSVTGEFNIPAECNTVGCVVVGIILNQSGLSGVSCTPLAGGCRCSGSLESASEGSESDYATDGDNITLDDVESTYCATDDSFKYTGEIEGVEFVYETVPQ